jgi:glutamate N-acetyltransferase/amino-acid N-acetyltransferase
MVARTVAGSTLFKAAVHGRDPNWGRVIAAAGRSGVDIIPDKLDLYIGEICLVEKGLPVSFNRQEVVGLLGGDEVSVSLNLNMGNIGATAWGCDLSEEYVTINSVYTT